MKNYVCLFILFIITLYVQKKENKKEYKNIINPCIVFIGVWLIIMFANSLHIYGLYSASNKAIIIINIGVISFAIGYFISFAKKNKIKKDINSYTIRYRYVYILCLICLVYFIIKFIRSFELIISGSSLANIREIVQNNNQSSEINNLIYNFLVLPSAYSIEVLAITDYWIGKKNKVLFFCNLIIIFLRVIGDAGRTPLINFILYMILGYIVSKDIQKAGANNKETRKYILIGILLLIIATFSRITSSIWRISYFYISMSPVLLGEWVNRVEEQNLLTYGITSFNGIFFTLNYFIKNILGLNDYIPIIKKSYDIIAATDSNWIKINAGTTTANAYVSLFWFFFTDGRLLGVVLGSVLFGYICGDRYFKLIKNINLKNLAIYMLLFQSVIFSFIRFYFAKPYFILAYLFIILLIKKEKENVNSKN